MSIKLKIIGDGMDVDKNISLTQAGRIIAFLGSEAELHSAAMGNDQLTRENVTMIDSQTKNLRRSVRELINEANPRTHAQRITVFGHFVAQGRPQGFFTSEEVKNQYQLAREKLTPKFNREVNKAISAGWVEPVNGKTGTFFVTRKGEDAISSAFRDTSKSQNKSKIKSTGSRAVVISEDAVRENVRSIQPVVPTLDGFSNYHKLKTKGLKIMWLLAMAQKHNIDYLSTKELAFFASKLRDKLATSDINGHTRTAAKNGWVTKDNDANYFLLHDGEEKLKSLINDEDETN